MLGSKVVLNMLDVVKEQQSYSVFFDNLFTGYEFTGSSSRTRLSSNWNCAREQAKEMSFDGSKRKKKRNIQLLI